MNVCRWNYRPRHFKTLWRQAFPVSYDKATIIAAERYPHNRQSQRRVALERHQIAHRSDPRLPAERNTTKRCLADRSKQIRQDPRTSISPPSTRNVPLDEPPWCFENGLLLPSPSNPDGLIEPSHRAKIGHTRFTTGVFERRQNRHLGKNMPGLAGSNCWPQWLALLTCT